jgi:hypothetical protein
MVAVPATFGQPEPEGVFVVIVKITLLVVTGGLVAGVYVALTKIGFVPEVTLFEKPPFGADQVPDVAFPVKVPTTEIEPSEQTDCVADGTVTPLKLFTPTTRLFEAPLFPHGL